MIEGTLDHEAVACLRGLCRVWRGLAGNAEPKHDLEVIDSELIFRGHATGLKLDPTETALLAYLLEHRGTVFTPETLLSRLGWLQIGRDVTFLERKITAVNTLTRRSGLPSDPIEDFHGVGYRLKLPNEI